MKLALVLFGLAYLISPVDLIPDLLVPWLGWIDDGVILWSIYHLIRYGDLPWFRFKKNSGSRRFSSSPRHTQAKSHRTSSPGQYSNTARQEGCDQKRQTGGTAGYAESGPGGSQRSSTPKHGRQSDQTPSDVLGVSPNASQKEIQKAYKEKIKQYHPDKLSHLGQAFTDLANEKFLEIQDAYDKLKKF